MKLSCYGGHSGCIQNSTSIFKAWIEDEVCVLIMLKLLLSNVGLYCTVSLIKLLTIRIMPEIVSFEGQISYIFAIKREGA